MVLECLYYNVTESSCKSSYADCAKPIHCQPNENNHCFVIWHLNNTDSVVDYAGCHQHQELDECGTSNCTGKEGRTFSICCCLDRLCNTKFSLPPPQPSQPSGNSTQPSQLQPIPTHNYRDIILLSLPILLLAAIICAYVYKSKRKRINSSTFIGIQTEARNNNRRIDDRNLTSNELIEYRNNNNLSIITPFRKVFGGGANGVNGDFLANHHHNKNNHYHSDDTHHQQQLNNLNNPRNHHDAIKQKKLIDLDSIKLFEVIGSGRFGTVHRAHIKLSDNNINTDLDIINNSDDSRRNFKDKMFDKNDEPNDSEQEKQGDKLNDLSEIAVKIIQANDHQSWLNEQQVYCLAKLKHKNILNFIGYGEHLESETYWLVVEYARKGSLYNYLKSNTVTWGEFLFISIGIVHGLAHLHEVEIAHRDFKSKNVLLRQDLTPCITDFGVAAILDTTQGSQLDHRKKYLQVGTPRYMAPEVLECSVTFTKSSFTKIDVYALSLVLWELLSRCWPLPNASMQANLGTSNDDQQQQAESYKMPFEDESGPQPDINEMRQIVVFRKKRPVLRNEWRLYPVSEFCRAIEDGWEYDCDARISASCFVERVEMVAEEQPMRVS